MSGLIRNIIFYILIIQDGFSGGVTNCLDEFTVINKTSGWIAVTDDSENDIPCLWTFHSSLKNYEVAISVQTNKKFPEIWLYDRDISKRSCTNKRTLCGSYTHKGRHYNGTCFGKGLFSWFGKCIDDRSNEEKCRPCLRIFGDTSGYVEIEEDQSYCYSNCANRTQLTGNCNFHSGRRTDAILEYYDDDNDRPFNITYQITSCNDNIVSTVSSTTQTAPTSSSNTGGTSEDVTSVSGRFTEPITTSNYFDGTVKNPIEPTQGRPNTGFAETEKQKTRRIVTIVAPVLAVVILILVAGLIIVFIKRRPQRDSNAADHGKVEVSNVLYESYPGGGERQDVDNVLYGTTS